MDTYDILRFQGQTRAYATRMQSHNRTVEDIRKQAEELQARADALKAALNAMALRMQSARSSVAQARAQAPTPIPAGPATIIALLPAPLPAAAKPRSNALRFMLHALFAMTLTTAAGLGLGLQGQTGPGSEPAPIPRATPMLDAWAAPLDADTPENEALRLVYEYRLPGMERTVLDLVSDEETVLGPSPWSIEAVGEGRYAVSFDPRHDRKSPERQEFEVDLVNQNVTPSPDTTLKLLSSCIVQN
ncbi:MAG: hypothetical protein WC881_12130 [Elusimicrobiota bacterium]|jgi:hypothetical protein